MQPFKNIWIRTTIEVDFGEVKTWCCSMIFSIEVFECMLHNKMQSDVWRVQKVCFCFFCFSTE